MKTKSKRSEYDVQKALCDFMEWKYPKAEYFSDLAGCNLSRSERKHYRLRKGKGFPDFYLFEVMDTRFNGLFIELKREGTEKKVLGKNNGFSNDKHIQEQLSKILKLRERGYCVGFAIGAVAAQMIVTGYLNGDLEKINKYLKPTIKPIF